MIALRQTMRQFFGSFEARGASDGRTFTGQQFSQINATAANPQGAVFPEGYAMIRGVPPANQPIPAPMPYIAYPLIKQGFGQQTVISASIWNRVPGNPGHFALVDHVVEQFQERFRDGGLILRPDDDSGLIALYFDRYFYMDDPSDNLITRGIMQMQIKDYIL